MDNIKNENTISSQKNNLNDINAANKAFLKTELNVMKQDLLYFKNDILLDIRKLKEQFDLKLKENQKENLDIFETYQKKFDSLSDQINLINSKMIDNNDILEKTKSVMTFKSRAENQLSIFSSKINTFQKEYRDYFNNIEKLVDSNLRYPGIVGKNSRFANFRRFIDYILTYFQEFNDFKDKIKNFGLDSFKREVSSRLQEFKHAISDGYSTSLSLIQSNIKIFDSKLADVIKKNNQINEENEKKFEELRKKIVVDISEYQKKFININKNIEDKNKEQLNNFENMKNKFLEDMNNMKNDIEADSKLLESKFEKLEDNFKTINLNKTNNNISEDHHFTKEILSNSNNNMSISDKISEKIVLEGNKDSNIPVLVRNPSNKLYITSKGKNHFINKEKNSNKKKNSQFIFNHSQEKNINIIDNYQISDEKNITEKISIIEKRSNKTQTNDHSKSFDKIYDYFDIKKNFYENLDSRNIHKRFSLTQGELNHKDKRKLFLNGVLEKRMGKNDFENSVNLQLKDALKHNYSVSNIPNIKIKKLIIPAFLTKRNANLKLSNSLLSDNKRSQNISNNHPSSSKVFLKEGTNKKRSLFGISKINKHIDENKKGRKHSENSKSLDKEDKINDSLKFFQVMKIKQPKNVYNNLDNINKEKKRKLSFENKKNMIGEKSQISMRKTHYGKSILMDLLLVNSKSFKKSRKISLN